jgi:hypothetical protein
LNLAPDIRLACGITSFLCLCVIILQLVVAVNQDVTAKAVTAEVKLLRSELAKHDAAIIERLSSILTEMDLAHSKFTAGQ